MTGSEMTDRPDPRQRSFDRVDWGSLDAEQARYLRRRVQFWRNVATMLGLGIVLVVVVLLVRRSAICDRCFASLEHYGRVATALKLSEANVATLRLQWQNLDAAKSGFLPSHYQLLPQNWAAEPRGDEAIPLAVCEYGHGTMTGEGRNVLYRTSRGMEVRFVSEKAAAPIADEGVRGERALPHVR
jgi:hypothetical protein